MSNTGKRGPRRAVARWGEEERTLRLNHAACGVVRLSGFGDDEERKVDT